MQSREKYNIANICSGTGGLVAELKGKLRRDSSIRKRVGILERFQSNNEIEGNDSAYAR